MNFLNLIREKKEQRAATAGETYATLVGKAARDGDLIAADTGKLEKAADELAIPVDRIAADVEIVRQRDALAATVADEPNLRRKSEALSADLRKLDDERESLIVAHNLKLREIAARRAPMSHAADLAARDASAAHWDAPKALREIEAKHPHLFGDAPSDPT